MRFGWVRRCRVGGLLLLPVVVWVRAMCAALAKIWRIVGVSRCECDSFGVVYRRGDVG